MDLPSDLEILRTKTPDSNMELLTDVDVASYKGNYPLSQLAKCRETLIISYYKTPALNSVEMELKRKSGIFTRDVINYFYNDLKPENFEETYSPSKPLDDSFELLVIQVNDHDHDHDGYDNNNNSDSNNNNSNNNRISEKDDGQNHQDLNDNDYYKSKNQNNANESEKIEHENETNLTRSSNRICVLRTKSIETNEKELDDADIKQMCRDLKLAHGCSTQNLVCPRSLVKRYDSAACSSAACSSAACSSASTIFICDFCFKSDRSAVAMDEHLESKQHYSASEYILADDNVDENASSSTIDVKLKITGLFKRMSLVSRPIQFRGLPLSVFCPRCLFNFDRQILACAIHYKYVHQENSYVYALGELVERKTLRLCKIHYCLECNKHFKKLKDLAYHIDTTRHRPAARSGEINIFHCPFDECEFSTNTFFDFKFHVLGHRFFQDPKCSPEREVEFTMLVYSKPTLFHHIVPFDKTVKSDIQEEIYAIEKQLVLYKSHAEFNDLSKRLSSICNDLKKLLD